MVMRATKPDSCARPLWGSGAILPSLFTAALACFILVSQPGAAPAATNTVPKGNASPAPQKPYSPAPARTSQQSTVPASSVVKYQTYQPSTVPASSVVKYQTYQPSTVPASSVVKYQSYQPSAVSAGSAAKYQTSQQPAVP